MAIQSVRDPAFVAMKEMNAEIAWWYKLLLESVQFWGSRAIPEDTFYTGLNTPLLFDTLSPVFNCPFSTTIDWNIAYRFSDSKGIIIKMVPAAGSWDHYFDVEWLSDFDYERERLFVFANNLRSVDIECFDETGRVTNDIFVACFSLFSSLFCGHFLWPFLKKKLLDQVLLFMIRRYKMDHEIGSGMEEVEEVLIPFYMEQIFHNLMEKFRIKSQTEYHYLIKSEYMLLSNALQRELVQFDDEDIMMISPFLKSLACSSNNILLLEEYVWIIADEELDKLKGMSAGHRMWSKDEYAFQAPDGGYVKFQLFVARQTSGSEFAGSGFKIKGSSYDTVRGRFSVNVDEVGWHCNSFPFSRLSVDGMSGTFTFSDKLVNNVTIFILINIICGKQCWIHCKIEEYIITNVRVS